MAEHVNKEVVAGIRPENLHIGSVTAEQTMMSSLSVNVELAELLGSEIYLYCTSDGVNIIAKVPPHNAPKAGEITKLYVDCTKLHLFDKESGVAI